MRMYEKDLIFFYKWTIGQWMAYFSTKPLVVSSVCAGHGLLNNLTQHTERHIRMFMLILFCHYLPFS